MPFPELKIGYYEIDERLEDWPTVFTYHYWSSDRSLFKQMTSRWKNEEQRLAEISRRLVNDNDLVWDKVLYEGTNPISQVEISGGGVQYSQGPIYNYKRDLRGLKFYQTKIFDANNSIHYTRLEFCFFDKLLLNGSMADRFGTMFFFQNNISNSYFSDCEFRNGSFWEGACKNVVFYNCTFENFALNVNSKDNNEYSSIAFLNCRFDKVDLSRIDIRSCLFFGMCNFRDIIINDSDFTAFQSVGLELLKKCIEFDKGSWGIRRRIKSTTYTSTPDGKSTKTINYFPNGETEKSKSKKYQNTLPAFTGLSNLYEYLITQYESKHHRINLVRSEYIFNWINDEIDLLKRGWLIYPKLFVSRMLLGYGYKAYRPLLAWLSIVLFFSFGYLFTGIRYNNHIILRGTYLDFKEIYPTVFDFGKCLYFSIITSTTVGYGDMSPYGILSHALAATQSILGLLFFTLFTVVLTRRLFR